MNIANPSPQTIAKQIAQEPWEVLRQAGRQVVGAERPPVPTEGDLSKAAITQENEKFLADRDKVRSQRLLQALEAEIKEISGAKEQKRTAPLSQEPQEPKPLLEVAAKPGRKFPRIFGGGKKTQMQRQQTQTERPLPPSG